MGPGSLTCDTPLLLFYKNQNTSVDYRANLRTKREELKHLQNLNTSQLFLCNLGREELSFVKTS
jgi:hypothetical protein